MDLFTPVTQAILAGLLALIPGVAGIGCLPAGLQRMAAPGLIFGQVTAAWLVQTLYFFNIPSSFSLGVTATLSIGIILLRRKSLFEYRTEVRKDIRLFVPFFLICLLLVSLVVWPAAGPWAADWAESVRQLRAIHVGAPFTDWMLARPPLFAALGEPYQLFAPSLSAFQLGVSVATASALISLTAMVASFGLKQVTPPFILAGLLLTSPFFLVNFTSFVPKFLQATLILNSFMALRIAEGVTIHKRVMLSSIFFGLATEMHHSTVAYSPALLVAILYASRTKKRLELAPLFLSAIPILILVGLPEIQRLLRFGLEEISQHNPSKVMRSSEPVWFVMIMTILCKFVGYGILQPIYMYFKELYFGYPRLLSEYLNWIWHSYMGMASNTFFFILLPFVFTLSRLRSFITHLRATIPMRGILMLMSSIPINCFLNPYYISAGNVHCGSTVVALASLLVAISWLSVHPEHVKGTLIFTAIGGFLPWLGWQMLQQSAVRRSGGVFTSGACFDDNIDQSALVHIGEHPWGYIQYPLLSLLLITTVLPFFLQDFNFRKPCHPRVKVP